MSGALAAAAAVRHSELIDPRGNRKAVAYKQRLQKKNGGQTCAPLSEWSPCLLLGLGFALGLFRLSVCSFDPL